MKKTAIELFPWCTFHIKTRVCLKYFVKMEIAKNGRLLQQATPLLERAMTSLWKDGELYFV